ncbi:uncharacterized protein BYT42DRAFT_612213 [Radiomyces spectabilis]|uniref:uncharacterized protein n=1 Tax=Radiomyces spectabilis TaxID=64574 RepID=UPI0022200B44|nr:uncharacterized protein BYT42DRAFT_612213 [Radiomyces spectabilis]KAI8384518.1 hypothetical protein BYT42DRAFT_612213 [Radiomyces spectabilis]
MKRSSAPRVNDLQSEPVTIWTLADHPAKLSQGSDARVASRVFQDLVEAVWTDGVSATIDRESLEDLAKLCKPDKGVAKRLAAALSSESESRIPIIRNSPLYRHLVIRKSQGRLYALAVRLQSTAHTMAISTG